MKKLLLILAFLCSINTLSQAQNIPNPDFDSLYIGGIDRLYGWGNSWGCSFEPFAIMWHVTVTYTEGFLAARLRTVSDTGGIHPSFLFSTGFNNYTNPGCDELFMKTGQPFLFKPDKMQGVYTFWNDSSLTNDYGMAYVILKRFNASTQLADTIGFGSASLLPTQPSTTFQPFEVPIHYINPTEVPDSIVVVFYSTGANLAGGVLTVDSLSFDYSSNTRTIVQHSSLDATVFPNPVQDVVNIALQKQENSLPTQCQIFDLYGRMLLEEEFETTNFRISMKDFPLGVYFFYLKNDNQQKVVKVIKK